jgi:hypothetical protein
MTRPHRGQVVHDLDVLARGPGPAVGRRLEDRPQLRIALTEHEEGPRLDDPGLLPRHRRPPVPHAVGVVPSDVGDDRDRAVDRVGRVPATEQPHLDDGDVDRDLGEPGEGGGGQQLEVRRRHPRQRLELRHVGDEGGERLVLDRLQVPQQPLVHPLQVGAGVGADGQVVGDQQRGDHPTDGALPVGPRDVDDRIGALGIAEDGEQPLDRLQAQARHPARRRLAVDVRVEVVEGGLVVHGRRLRARRPGSPFV